MRMPATAIALLVWTLNLACGEGGGPPGGPTQPLPPDLGADIVAAGTVSIGLCSGPGCAYSLNYRNDGRGCANTVHGTVRAFQEGSLLQADDWWLLSTQVIDPGETFLVEDCCFGPDTVRRATRFVSETFWNNVPCS